MRFRIGVLLGVWWLLCVGAGFARAGEALVTDPAQSIPWAEISSERVQNWWDHNPHDPDPPLPERIAGLFADHAERTHPYERAHTFFTINTLYTPDPFVWSYTAAFAKRFRMPEQWIDPDLEGALGLAFRMREPTVFDQLSQAPGLGYLATVRTLPGVDWKGVEETYRSWHDQKSGIGGGAMVLIALATAVLTAGATASLAANIVGVAEVAAGASIPAGMATMSMAGATYAATAAQLTAMTMTNAVLAGAAGTVSTSVANGAVSGDMQGALRSIVSSNTLRSLVVSALTAGLTQGVSDGLGLDSGITRAGSEAGSTATAGATAATTTAGATAATTTTTAAAGASAATTGATAAGAAGRLAGLGQTVAQAAVNTGVLAVVDMAVNGEGLDTAARSALMTGAVGVVSAQVFQGIGDLGVEFGIGEGAVRKGAWRAPGTLEFVNLRNQRQQLKRDLNSVSFQHYSILGHPFLHPYSAICFFVSVAPWEPFGILTWWEHVKSSRRLVRQHLQYRSRWAFSRFVLQGEWCGLAAQKIVRFFGLKGVYFWQVVGGLEVLLLPPALR